MIKKFFIIALTALLTVSAAACGRDKGENENSVKVPKSIGIESSVTYDEAIEGIRYDEKTAYIMDWVDDIYKNLLLLTMPTTIQESSGRVISNMIEDKKTGESRINTEVTNECLRNLETAFKAEPEYTEHMSKIPFAALREAYLKFIGISKEMEQKYSETGPTFDPIYNDFSKDKVYSRFYQYYSSIPKYDENADAKEYFQLLTGIMEGSLYTIESYCIYDRSISQTEKEQNTAQQRVDYSLFSGAANLYDVDFELSRLETVMGMKNSLDAIADRCFGTDETAVKAYNDYMKEVNRLYEIVRLHHPEDASTGYAQTYDFNLDNLVELSQKLNEI